MVLFLSYSSQNYVVFYFGIYAPSPFLPSSLNFINNFVKDHKCWSPHYIIFNI